MANKRLDYDKIYELVMQCRQSGLSDKQWCLDNNIAPSTFYYWIRRLQQKACYNLPEARRNDIPAVAVKQDVVYNGSVVKTKILYFYNELIY